MDEKQPLLKNNENQSQVVDVENAGKEKFFSFNYLHDIELDVPNAISKLPLLKHS